MKYQILDRLVVADYSKTKVFERCCFCQKKREFCVFVNGCKLGLLQPEKTRKGIWATNLPTNMNLYRWHSY